MNSASVVAARQEVYFGILPKKSTLEKRVLAKFIVKPRCEFICGSLIGRKGRIQALPWFTFWWSRFFRDQYQHLHVVHLELKLLWSSGVSCGLLKGFYWQDGMRLGLPTYNTHYPVKLFKGIHLSLLVMSSSHHRGKTCEGYILMRYEVA